MSRTRTKPRPPAAGFHRLAIDFDGVLMVPVRTHRFDAGQCLGEPMPGTREALADLSRRFELCVFSVRATNAQGRIGIAAWLRKHGLLKYFRGGVTGDKPNALAYIDDRARHFDGEWGPILKEFGGDVGIDPPPFMTRGGGHG